MLTPEYLRRQAENCLRIARTCFDLASAERLRLMAGELNAKATEMERKSGRNAGRTPWSGIRPPRTAIAISHPVRHGGAAEPYACDAPQARTEALRPELRR